MPEIVLEVNRLSKTYDLHSNGKNMSCFDALKEVSFKIYEGDIVGIIGGNGSGKSTLLKILSHITKPSSGEAKVYGSVASILEIGTNFHPELTGKQNVELHLNLAGINKGEFATREKEILAISEIGDFFYQPVKVYSNGMFLRLAFAMAFHLSADIFLIDEVISVGDEGFRLKCQDMLKTLQQQGKTILFVSHSRLEILELSNKCIWLDKGQIRKIGNPAAVLSEYFALQRDNYDEQRVIVETHSQNNVYTGSEGTVHFEWSAEAAPGNEVLAIRQLSVLPPYGAGKLFNTQPIHIQFAIDKKNADVQIGAFFFLQDVFYQPVMVAHFLNNTTGIDYSSKLKNTTGLIEIYCTIPANFLMPGKYYLLPRFGMTSDDWSNSSEEVFRFSEELHFTVHPSPGYNDLIGDISKGTVRPPLEWGINVKSRG